MLFRSRGSPIIGAYCISKAADMQLARNLAVELGPHNVRVNCIAPGLIKTDFARALWEDDAMLAERNATTPLRRIGNPDEITILDFAKEVIALTGTTQKIVFRELPQDDPKVRQPDITKARTILNWEPKVNRKDGIARTYEYFRTDRKSTRLNSSH